MGLGLITIYLLSLLLLLFFFLFLSYSLLSLSLSLVSFAPLLVFHSNHSNYVFIFSLICEHGHYPDTETTYYRLGFTICFFFFFFLSLSLILFILNYFSF